MDCAVFTRRHVTVGHGKQHGLCDLVGASDAHLGKPALVGRGLGDLKQPVDLMSILRSDAQQLGFLFGRQDCSLRRDAGPQDLDLGLKQPQLRVVPGHEKLGQENDN